MEQISEEHQKQLTTLREEIRTKENQMETLKEFVKQGETNSLKVDRRRRLLLHLVHYKNFSCLMTNSPLITRN